MFQKILKKNLQGVSWRPAFPFTEAKQDKDAPY